MSKEGQDKIHEMVTGRIMDALKDGKLPPWVKPWNAAYGSLPVSMSSRKPYRGVNVWLLALEADEKGYTSPWWGTFNHIRDLGGMVRKGEQSTVVVFNKRIVTKDKITGDDKVFYMLRYYRVFNASQADGLPERFFPKPVAVDNDKLPEEADKIIAHYLDNGGPTLVRKEGDRANYAPAIDVVVLPLVSQFKNGPLLYAAAFHELGHSTGHASRLDRPGIAEFDHFGSQKYAKEELVASMTAAILSATVGNDIVIENEAAYIKGWLRALENDSHLVISASAQAQRASDMILGTKFEKAEAE